MTLDDQFIFAQLLGVGLLALFFWTMLRGLFPKRRKFIPPKQGKWAIIDGSNVMHWDGGKPKIATVRRVVDHLIAHDFTPSVMFDANAGYLLVGKYQHDGALSKALGLPESHVMVVPKGTPADPAILTAARDYNARIVTNDRFRDWTREFPEVRKPGHLIKGGFRSGTLFLQLQKTGKPRKKRQAHG
ncbi:MAG: hypothetical protein AB8B47_05435 [Roseobacter sp.]